MKNENLGCANRNPLNIRYVSTNHWLGLHPATPNVKGFCKFIAPDYGYRAAVVLLKNYITRYGCDTPEKVIARWAPPSENRTALYVACVCGRSRLRPDETLSTEGPQIGRLIAAMAKQETGMHITPEGVDDIRRKFNV
ncbi:MAG: structural protein P5 [Bacteroidales bacterium]|nr:structural protein P5 [Bacteroidales bacterium]